MKTLLQGKRVRLTQVTKDDLEAIADWYHNSHFSRMFDALPAAPRTMDQLESWLNESNESNNQYTFAIRNESNEFVGYVELESILWIHRNGWVSIAIGDEEHQGKGYGMEAMQLLIDFAFYECNLHRLQLTVFSYNLPAISMYEKLGFQKEGTHREFLLRDGQAFDMHLYGLLDHEWIK
ncbi:N-acetyltransferase [Thalassobacillus devorans]|uniref:N-acetyltransferase n=1 Tax=Thalassobacillus devorans TaxID=279813 RepID=A0ABQ1PHU0_9BACI|nr:GNAT family protein [Thalassobacillus devorans]NIK29977.1 RimJ/RimL family protein N-acetyltransferase [Thalassobacillus devorans]GGC97354.1 N-acetyltransferase [Thalassobacillus devorans]